MFGEINCCVCFCKGNFLGPQVYEAATEKGSCVLGVGKIRSLGVRYPGWKFHNLERAPAGRERIGGCQRREDNDREFIHGERRGSV